MITVTISGKEKTGKTIIANLIAEALEHCGLQYSKRNFEDKFLSAAEARFAINEIVEIVELAERNDRPEGEGH